MSERLFPLKSAAGAVEYIKPQVPRLPELVEAWGNYLEFWAQTGGMDEAGFEELEAAHQSIQAHAEEILAEDDWDVRLVPAYSNLALAAAQEIRQRAFSAEPGEV